MPYLHRHSIPILIRLADLYLGDVRLLVSHVIDLSERLSQLSPAHRGARAMLLAANQISAITAERQLKLGELVDEVVRRTTAVHPPLTIIPPRPADSLAPTSSPSSPLLALPGEIRNLIYHFCLVPASRELRPYAAGNAVAPALLAACRQIRVEATPVLYGASTVVLDPFAAPRFMFQIAGASRWLRRVRVVGLAELKVLGVGRVRADELDGCGGGLRGGLRRRGRRVGRERDAEGGREEEEEEACWGEGEGVGGLDGGAFGDGAWQAEPLRLQLYLLRRATNLERLDVVWCGGAEDDALPAGVARPPGGAEAAARDVFGLLYPWLAAVAEARGERRAAARIVRPFTHLGDRGTGLDRAAFRKRLGALLEKGVQLDDEADEDVSME
ncbi:hypothetical protein SLS56_002387 [Neofusicoccum ribis]|uniref:F-box domain-containing protein n=1 Tax=Neofusicoccum ribis TaxID=45134 RepID=A0ABR3T4F5_9PEZI